jgi:hypothetical protein
VNFERRVLHANFLREDDFLRESHNRVIPLNHLASVEVPELFWKHGREDGLVEVSDLPPRVRGVLVLDLDDGNAATLRKENKAVGLTPTPRAAREEPEPRVRDILFPVESIEVLMNPPLVANPLESPARVMVLAKSGGRSEIR